MRLNLFFLTVSFVSLTPDVGMAQVPEYYRWTIGGEIGGQIGTALDGARNAMQQKALLTRELAEARQAFWAAYPDGANLDAAGERLSLALLSKDVMMLMVYAADGGSRGIVALDRLLGGQVDGGIPPRARDAFMTWVSRFEVAAGGGFGRMPVFTAETFQSALTGEAYGEYRRIRDLVELFAGPHSPFLEAETPVDQLAASFAYWGIGSPEDAQEAWDALVQVTGEVATRLVGALMDRADPTHPHRQFRFSLRQAMSETDDPAVYRTAGTLLDALAVEGWSFARLDSTIASRYSAVDLEAFVRGLMEREGGDGVDCGTDLHCFERIATFMSPQAVLDHLDYQVGQYSMEFHLNAMGDDGRSKLERETQAYRVTYRAWMNRLMDEGVSRRSEYYMPIAFLQPEPELVAMTGHQSVFRAWKAAEAIMALEAGCENERRPALRSGLCQLAAIASDYYWGTVGLVRWADGRVAEDNGRNSAATVANIIYGASIRDASRVLQRRNSDRQKPHAALFVDAGIRSLRDRCQELERCPLTERVEQAMQDLIAPWLDVLPYSKMAVGVEQARAVPPDTTESTVGDGGLECVMNPNAGLFPGLSAAAQAPTVLNIDEIRAAMGDPPFRGMATFAINVDEAGVVQTIQLLHRSGNAAIDRAACGVAQTYRFAPPAEGNEIWFVLPIVVSR